jgi:predicted transcriptional regulator
MYIADRNSGMAYQDIADKYGVSRQCVQQACARECKAKFRYNHSCIYPALKEWINENQVTTAELLRQLDMVRHQNNYDRIHKLLTGKQELKKHHIDKLLKMTGMTYEELFRGEEHGQE